MKTICRFTLLCSILLMFYPNPLKADEIRFRVESPDGKYVAYLRENGRKHPKILPKIRPFRDGIETSFIPDADLFIAKRIDKKDAEEQIIQLNVGMPSDAPVGFMLEVQAKWTNDSRYLIYRWRNSGQQEQLAIYDTLSNTQKTIITQDRLRRAKIPLDEVRLESFSPDRQFMVLQQGDRLVFYSIPDLKLSEPTLQNASYSSEADTCYMFYNGVMSYCVFWSPLGHRAAYTTTIQNREYLVVFDPAGKEKTRLSQLRELPKDKPHNGYIGWSPLSQYIAVMVITDSDIRQFTKMTLEYHTVTGIARLVADNVAFTEGESRTPLASWCKADVIAYIDADTNEAVAYSITQKIYERSAPIDWQYPEEEAAYAAIAQLRLCR